MRAIRCSQCTRAGRPHALPPVRSFGGRGGERARIAPRRLSERGLRHSAVVSLCARTSALGESTDPLLVSHTRICRSVNTTSPHTRPSCVPASQHASELPTHEPIDTLPQTLHNVGGIQVCYRRGPVRARASRSSPSAQHNPQKAFTLPEHCQRPHAAERSCTAVPWHQHAAQNHATKETHKAAHERRMQAFRD